MAQYRVMKAFDGPGPHVPGEVVETADWPRDNLHSLIRGDYLMRVDPEGEAGPTGDDAVFDQVGELRNLIADLTERIEALEDKATTPDEEAASEEPDASTDPPAEATAPDQPDAADDKAASAKPKAQKGDASGAR